MSERARVWLAAGVAAALLAVGLACGGGGGGPTSPPTPPPQPGITFSPSGSAGANSIHLARGTNPSAQRLALEVRVTDVADLYGLSFDLSYPTDRLDWDDAATAEGSFLDAGGTVATSLLITERPNGNLIIGFTRLGDVAGADGTDLLLTLEFTAVAGGSGSMTISNNSAFASDGSVQDDVSWIAGSVTVVL